MPVPGEWQWGVRWKKSQRCQPQSGESSAKTTTHNHIFCAHHHKNGTSQQNSDQNCNNGVNWSFGSQKWCWHKMVKWFFKTQLCTNCNSLHIIKFQAWLLAALMQPCWPLFSSALAQAFGFGVSRACFPSMWTWVNVFEWLQRFNAKHLCDCVLKFAAHCLVHNVLRGKKMLVMSRISMTLMWIQICETLHKIWHHVSITHGAVLHSASVACDMFFQLKIVPGFWVLPTFFILNERKNNWISLFIISINESNFPSIQNTNSSEHDRETLDIFLSPTLLWLVVIQITNMSQWSFPIVCIENATPVMCWLDETQTHIWKTTTNLAINFGLAAKHCVVAGLNIPQYLAPKEILRFQYPWQWRRALSSQLRRPSHFRILGVLNSDEDLSPHRWSRNLATARAIGIRSLIRDPLVVHIA